MAFALDATSFTNRYDPPSSSSLNQSHTCTGSDLLLVVGIGWYIDSSAPVTGVTYNGTSMTQLATYSPQSNAGLGSRALYYIKAPNTGTNNITISWTGNPSELYAVAGSFTGIEQTPTVTASGAYTPAISSTAQVSLTGMNTGDLIVGIAGGGNSNQNVGTGTTLAVRPSVNPQISMGYLSAAASSDTIDFTAGSSDWIAAVAAAFQEAGGATVNSNFFALM